MENYLLKYTNEIKNKLSKQMDNPENSVLIKQQLMYRLEALNDIEDRFLWQIKSQSQKQSSRISSLASMRKSGALPHFIKKQETAIYIYEKIQYTIPYLLALNHNVNQIIIDFTNEICDKIDFAGSNYRGDFPGNEEVQNVFNNFIKFQKPAQGNGGMFKECYEKIEELYVALIKLNEIA